MIEKIRASQYSVSSKEINDFVEVIHSFTFILNYKEPNHATN